MKSRNKSLESLTALTYFISVFLIYLYLEKITDSMTKISKFSEKDIFWILTAVSIIANTFFEILLLIKNGKKISNFDFEGKFPLSQFIKASINLFASAFIFYFLYIFIDKKNINFNNSLAFFSTAGMIYISTSAIFKYARCIPLLLIFLRWKNDRI
jgi:hypothetical protein